MTREEYLATLKRELKMLGETEVKEICGDFEEHFSVGLSQGKTEHEISAELGNPVTVAQTYLSGNIEQSSGYRATPESTAAVTQAVATNPVPEKDLTGPRLFVILFNIFFMVWVAVSVYSTVLSLWLVTFGLVVASVALFAVLFTVSTTAATGIALAAVAVLMFAVCSGIINFFLTKLTVYATGEYIKWNTKIYNEGF